MTSITTNYLSLNPISKTGIGGAITAAAVYGFAITNPLTIIAATAIGQGLAWLPDAARRCLRKAPIPLPVVPLAAPVRRPAAREQLSLREELELAAVLERSMLLQADDRKHQDDFDRALAMSLIDHDEDRKEPGVDDLQRVLRMSMDPQQQVKVCRLERAFKGAGENDPVEADEIIPEQFLVDAGKDQYYHLGNLVLNLLGSIQGENQYGHPQYRDALGKVFTVDDLEIFEARMGLNPGELVNIWVRATLPDAPQDVDPAVQAGRRSTYRMCLLRDALRARDPSRHINETRNSFLNFFNTKEIWTQLPANIRMV